jgi:ethanolamine-phosphate cytidylyltransferase
LCCLLQLARQQGDFLMVGLHTDEDVTARRGAHLPIMNVHERALSVLACKHVDEVIIGAPPAVSDYLLTTFNISLVVRGSVSETSSTAAER